MTNRLLFCALLPLALGPALGGCATEPHTCTAACCPRCCDRMQGAPEDAALEEWVARASVVGAPERQEVAAHLAAFGPRVTCIAVDWLDAEEPGLRFTGASVLRRMGHGAACATEALIAALDDPDPQVRAEAAYALEEIGPDARAAIPDLCGLLDDEGWEIRYQAARALGAMLRYAWCCHEALEHLSRHDPDHRVRQAAATAAEAIYEDWLVEQRAKKSGMR